MYACTHINHLAPTAKYWYRHYEPRAILYDAPPSVAAVASSHASLTLHTSQHHQPIHLFYPQNPQATPRNTAAFTMDTLLGIKGDGFVLIAADASAARSILVFKTDQDKIAQLDSHKLLAAAGPNADCSNLTEYVQKNMALYEFNNDLKLGTHAAANFIRRTLATALRKGPYQTNLLLGGFDEKDGASLYFMDYLGSMQKLNFGAQGYAANFTLSIFDREYKEGLTLAEAEEILEKAKKELAVRFLISQPKWIMKVVDKDGVRTL